MSTATSIQTSATPLGRDDLARLVAKDIAPGSFVNLGIGQPTLVSNYLTEEQDITLHTENGMLGMGPAAEGTRSTATSSTPARSPSPNSPEPPTSTTRTPSRSCAAGTWTSASSARSRSPPPVTWRTGTPGHPGAIPAVGGAMDLATGAKDVFVMMTLLTREGASKIVETCTYPLTGVGCVTRVYTDKAVFLTGPDGVTVRETFGCTLEELQELVPVPLKAAASVVEPVETSAVTAT
jgi:3-oxoadipate CoA-transferase beta subunit